MAYNTQLSDAAANAAANAAAALANGGSIKFYTTPQPANANTAISSQTLLATLPLSATAFGSASAGVCMANAITTANAVASGTAVWFRVCSSGGAGLWDGSIGTSGCNVNLVTTTIQSGVPQSLSSYSYSAVEVNTNG